MCQPATIDQEVKVHPFEAQGLGKALFVCVGMQKNVYTGGGGSQPGGTCRFCGTGIMYEYLIKSSDGRLFVVGSDCVHKTNDPKLVPAVESLERQRKREMAREARRRRDQAALAKAQEQLPGLREWVKASREQLSAIPHPNQWRASQGDSLADYLEWSLAHRSAVDSVGVILLWQSKVSI